MRAEASTDFTAVADCPKCGNVAVHWLAAPRLDPGDCLHRHCVSFPRPLRAVGDHEVFSWGSPRELRCVDCGTWLSGRYDPVDCVVARVCRECEHRWPMK